VKRSLSLILAASAVLTSHSFAQDLDLIVRGGVLIDGSGSPATKADIGIKGDRIVFVGNGAGRKARPRAGGAEAAVHKASPAHRPSIEIRRQGDSPILEESNEIGHASGLENLSSSALPYPEAKKPRISGLLSC
jgi:hypothetical protein